jgi:hypothetical protein
MSVKLLERDGHNAVEAKKLFARNSLSCRRCTSRIAGEWNETLRISKAAQHEIQVDRASTKGFRFLAAGMPSVLGVEDDIPRYRQIHQDTR